MIIVIPLVIVFIIASAFGEQAEINVHKELIEIKNILKLHESKIYELQATVKNHKTEIHRLNNYIIRLVQKDRKCVPDRDVIANETGSLGYNQHSILPDNKNMQNNGPDNIERDKIHKRNVDSVTGEIKQLNNVPIQTSTVAFYAYMTNNENNIRHQQTLVFNSVVTNVGNSYNMASGIFTASQSGTYVFTVTLFPDRGTQIGVNIYRNSEIIGQIWTEMKSAFSASTPVVVVSMNVGDRAYVRTSKTAFIVGNVHSDNDVRTSFAGWKLA